jgi:two-component sensor histidine kinase
LSNAFKYARGSHVEVSLATEAEAVLRVEDRGPGIPATADLEETSQSLQAAAHMTKPVPLAKLVEIVSRFCTRAA